MIEMRAINGNGMFNMLDLGFVFYEDKKFVLDGDVKELLKRAEKDNPITICNIGDIIPVGHSPLWVVMAGNYGAAAIAYSDFIAKASEKVGDDFYILPSSIYELLIISASDFEDGAMSEMVRSINATEVAEADRLVDHAYHCKNGKIEII